MPYEPTFPHELEPLSLSLLNALAVGEQWPASQGFVVSIQSQVLSAPSRVYYSPSVLSSIISGSVGETQALALCLGSRHWDGYIREACIRELIKFDYPWVVPFVIQLLGEYVIQIVSFVFEALPSLNSAAFGAFVHENPKFLATTKRRAISYWNCYFRHQYKHLSEYPGIMAINLVEGMV